VLDAAGAAAGSAEGSGALRPGWAPCPADALREALAERPDLDRAVAGEACTLVV
jgi:hypothetical protein